MVDFPSGKKRALDFPFLAIAGAKNKCAFARAGPHGDGGGFCHRVNHKPSPGSFERKIVPPLLNHSRRDATEFGQLLSSVAAQ
jgi:hypothetical protein